MSSGGRALIQRPPSAGEEDGDRALVESTFSDAAQEQVTNAAGAPRPDDEQLRATRCDRTEEIAQRFAVDEDGPRVPSDAFEYLNRAAAKKEPPVRATTEPAFQCLKLLNRSFGTRRCRASRLRQPPCVTTRKCEVFPCW